MSRARGWIAAVVFACLAVPALAETPPPPQPALTAEQAALLEKWKAIAKQLHPQYGEVVLPGAHATLHLGKSYYFLPAKEARLVIVDAWRNAPEEGEGILGIVFPAGKNFTDDTWAAIVSYSNDGYISDDNAKDVDYDAMIQQAHDQDAAVNTHRKQLGLDSMHVIGWAQPPYYDEKHRSLIWAREIQFGDSHDHTLNYDVRELGRSGVLSMNIVAAMSQLALVRQAANRLQNVGTYDRGARYIDFNSTVDKKAAYGIGGLVAAGLGVAVAQKLGFLGVILLFAKKFIAIFLAAGAGLVAWLRRMFGGRNTSPPAPPAA